MLRTNKRYAEGVYPVADLSKNTVRLQLYKEHVVSTPRWAETITLAGHEAEYEASLLFDHLRRDPRLSTFVDWAKEPTTRAAILTGFDGLKARYPGVNTICDDIVEVLRNKPKDARIGFAYLDFMGLLTRKYVQPAIVETCFRLAPNGIIALTFYVGRESSIQHAARDVWTAAGEDICDPAAMNDDTRWRGVRELVTGLARRVGCKLEFVQGWTYTHQTTRTHSKMNLAIWRRI
jgi:hypothetical protein